MSRALELREAFDAGFAGAVRQSDPTLRDFLCIRVAGEPSAIALADVASLHADLRIVALPTRAPELLGVAAIRAAIVPIYDLGVAFGSASTGAIRWTVVIRSGAAGFAFDGFDGYIRVPAQAIAAAHRAHTRGLFLLGEQPRAVVDLGSVLTSIETRWRQTGTAKDL